MKFLTNFLLIPLSLMLIACGTAPEDPNSDAVTSGEPWIADKAFRVVVQYGATNAWDSYLFESVYTLSEMKAKRVINESYDSVLSDGEAMYMDTSISYSLMGYSGEEKSRVHSNMRFSYFMCDSVETDPLIPSEEGYSFEDINFSEGLYRITVKYSSPNRKVFMPLKRETYSIAQKMFRDHFSLPRSTSFKDIIVDMRYRYDSAGTHLYARLAFMKE